MNKALNLVDQVMAYRPPPRVYSFYLKEQFLLFQLMMTIRDVNFEFKNAQDFYSMYQTLPSWKKNLLCELYLHNFIIPHETKWNPLLYIGDVHLRALMSWMHNEKNYDRKLDAYRELEKFEPLSLRAESCKLDELLRDWLKLTSGGLKLEIREKVFSER